MPNDAKPRKCGTFSMTVYGISQGGQHTKSKNGSGSFNDADLGAVAEMFKVLLAREKNHTIPGSPPGLCNLYQRLLRMQLQLGEKLSIYGNVHGTIS